MTETPAIIARDAPNDAPDATPNVNGDTSGLPKQPCINAPATARATPATIPISIRGNLNFQIISESVSVPCSRPKIIFPVVTNPNFSDDPIPMAKKANRIVADVAIKIMVICNEPLSICLCERASMTSLQGIVTNKFSYSLNAVVFCEVFIEI